MSRNYDHHWNKGGNSKLARALQEAIREHWKESRAEQRLRSQGRKGSGSKGNGDQLKPENYKMPFGQYKGARLRWIARVGVSGKGDMDYLRWVARTFDPSSDVRSWVQWFLDGEAKKGQA